MWERARSMQSAGDRSLAAAMSSTLVLSALLLWPATVSAQQPPREPRVPVEADDSNRDRLAAGAQAVFSADLQLGPLLLQPEIGASGGWQTLATRRNRGDSSELSNDFRVSLSPLIRVALPMRGGRHVVSVTPRVDYDWFAEFEGLRTLDFVVPTSYRFESPRMSADLGYTWIDGEQGFLDPIQGDEGQLVPEFELDQRTSFNDNRVDGNLDFNLTDRLILGFDAGWRDIAFAERESADGFDLTDRNRSQVTYGASVDYSLVPSTSIFFDYQRTDDRPDDPDSFRDRTRDEYGAGLAFSLDPTFSSSVEVGYQLFENEAPDRPDAETLIVDGRVSVQPSGWVRLQLSGGRTAEPSFWENNAHFDRRHLDGSVQFGVGNALLLGARAGYAILNWPLESTVAQLDGSLLTAKRRDETLRYSGTVGWRVTQRNGINLEIGYFERISNFDTQTLDGLLLRASYSLIY